MASLEAALHYHRWPPALEVANVQIGRYRRLMRKRQAVPARRVSYHHGDLRRVVLDASLGLIESDGVDALSLREVARRAGVTHGAPYHHFADKAALLDALAEEGFVLLRDAMEAALGEHRGAGQRLAACGRAYVDFAVGHPAYFQAMFRPGKSSLRTRGPAAQAAFLVLVNAVLQCQEEGVAPRGDPEPLVLLAWSAVHGLSSLRLDGALRPESAGGKGRGTSEAAQLTGLVAKLFAAAGAGRAEQRRS
jgi:AcrR family transcriptional regulator